MGSIQEGTIFTGLGPSTECQVQDHIGLVELVQACMCAHASGLGSLLSALLVLCSQGNTWWACSGSNRQLTETWVHASVLRSPLSALCVQSYQGGAWLRGCST